MSLPRLRLHYACGHPHSIQRADVLLRIRWLQGAYATCVANYAGTTFTSGSYYLAQAAANGAQYQWNTPSWWGGVCALQCTSMVNCKGIGGTCATTYSGNPNTPGVAGSVGCNYVMFGSNYCQCVITCAYRDAPCCLTPRAGATP